MRKVHKKSLRLSLEDGVTGAFHFILNANLHIWVFNNEHLLIEKLLKELHYISIQPFTEGLRCVRVSGKKQLGLHTCHHLIPWNSPWHRYHCQVTCEEIMAYRGWELAEVSSPVSRRAGWQLRSVTPLTSKLRGVRAALNARFSEGRESCYRGKEDHTWKWAKMGSMPISTNN